MALDATVGGSSSNAYVTKDEADDFHGSLGSSAWVSETSASLKESAIVRATAWVDRRYSLEFSGARVGGRSQALEWPRTGAIDRAGQEVDSSSIPVEIKRAVFQAALVELQNPGILTEVVDPTNPIKVKEKLGPMEIQYNAVSGSKEDLRVGYLSVEETLAPLLSKSGLSGAILVV